MTTEFDRDQEILIVRCALSDLIGARQAHEQGRSGIHDWSGHEATIKEVHDLLKSWGYDPEPIP